MDLKTMMMIVASRLLNKGDCEEEGGIFSFSDTTTTIYE